MLDFLRRCDKVTHERRALGPAAFEAMPIISALAEAFGTSNQHILLAALDQLAEGVIVADAKGRLVFVNKAATVIHGVNQLNIEPADYADAYHLLTAEGEPYPTHELPLSRAVEKGEPVEDAHWKIRRPDGHIVDALGTARPVFDGDGNQIGAVLTMSDETASVATRAERDAALAAKDTLLYEINHRVKNNLALVSSLLRIQSRAITDARARASMEDLSRRIATLGDLHRRLYETGGHTEVEVVAFLSENIQQTVRALAPDDDVTVRVTSHGRADLHIDAAVPLVLAVNELVLNSLKHAFADVDDPEIAVTLEANGGQLDLLYKDNGSGIVHTGKSGSGGIGSVLIRNLSSQLGAALEEVSADAGYCVKLTVPLETGAS